MPEVPPVTTATFPSRLKICVLTDFSISVAGASAQFLAGSTPKQAASRESYINFYR
jgi:hypothetical protein